MHTAGLAVAAWFLALWPMGLHHLLMHHLRQQQGYLVNEKNRTRTHTTAAVMAAWCHLSGLRPLSVRRGLRSRHLLPAPPLTRAVLLESVQIALPRLLMMRLSPQAA